MQGQKHKDTQNYKTKKVNNLQFKDGAKSKTIVVITIMAHKKKTQIQSS